MGSSYPLHPWQVAALGFKHCLPRSQTRGCQRCTSSSDLFVIIEEICPSSCGALEDVPLTHTHTHTHTQSVCCLRPHRPSSLCTALGKDFPRMVSGWLLIPGWPRLPLKPSESLWGGLWLLLWSTVSVFSLVCLQGGDDEMEDGFAQLLSLACQSVLVLSFCQRVSRAGLKPMSSTLKEKSTYLQLKL